MIVRSTDFRFNFCFQAPSCSFLTSAAFRHSKKCAFNAEGEDVFCLICSAETESENRRTICLPPLPAVCPSSISFPRCLSSSAGTINYVCLYCNGRLSARTERRLQIYNFSLDARVSQSVSLYLTRSCKFCQSMIQNKNRMRKSF